MQLRPYQQLAIDDLYSWFTNHDAGNPVINLPTGSGKSFVIAHLCKDALQNWPETRVLMLTHQQELIEQNHAELINLWPNAPAGIYSAGLGKRNLAEPITFAGIGSVRKRAVQIGHVDLILIDEAHLVNNAQQGMYRKLIEQLKNINPALRVIGLSATPYRLGQGLLTEGKDALFHDIIEPVTITYLIKEGYLCELRSKSTSLKLDTSGVHKRGGEFIESELQSAVDNNLNNVQAVDEMIKRGADRKSWIVFCAGVLHAENINQILLERGVKSVIVTGATPKKERREILQKFKTQELQCVVNCKVLTTGFNHKGIDLIALLCPTLSPGLYVQMVGRGMRTFEDKTDCLILDFAGNIETHGPITNINPPSPKGVKEGEAPVKTCPECDEIVHAAIKICPCCGYEWPIQEKSYKLSNADIMGRDSTKVMELTDWEWSIHTSRTSGKELLKVRYYGQINDPIVEEYLCITYEGFAGNKARRQLADIGIKSGADVTVKNLEEVVMSMQAATPPHFVQYQKDGKFFRVTERIWESQQQDLRI